MNSAITKNHLDNYLQERRRLGFKLTTHSGCCKDFVRYLETQKHQGPLTAKQMAAWAKQDKWQTGNPATWARRLKALRPFMRYLQQFEPLTEVPTFLVFGPVPERGTPHIFHEQEIVDLLAAARALGPPGDLRASIHETLFGLIAACGLRLCEAVQLLDHDVDLTVGMLTVRQTKFGKSRHVPLHPTTVAALQRYRQLRNRFVKGTPESPFFIAWRGKFLGHRLPSRSVDRTFATLRERLGWPNRGMHHAARIHDLRHTFAVRRMMLWHQDGTDIDQAMLALSTYMGHTKISNTYWYLTAVPELMTLAADKFERFLQAKEAEHA